MNNQQKLINLMNLHRLTKFDVANMLCVSSMTVINWLKHPTNSNYRNMPDSKIAMLEMGIKLLNHKFDKPR